MENLFIEKFIEAVELEGKEITLDTKFRDLEEWDSLAGLSVIAMIDEEYDVVLEGNEFRALQTIGDLLIAIKVKMA